MRRSQFLALTALSLPTLLPAMETDRTAGLTNWASKYGAQVHRGTGNIAITLRTSPQQHAEALHSLSDLASSPLYCKGSELTGSIEEKPFRLRFA